MQKEKDPNNRIRLVRLPEEHTIVFKEEIQEAFQHGFQAHYPDPNMPEQFDQEDGLFKFEKRVK